MSLLTMSAQLAEGFLITVEIFVLTLLFSLPLGLIVAFGRMSGCKVIRIISKIYISIMRGTPLMLQIIVVYFAPFYVFRMQVGTGYRFPAVILAFVINYAAYFAEIYRAGIESIPVGQYEAAEVLGYSKAQTFVKIILPQVVKRVLPPVTNETITLVKDTSMAFTISIAEMFTVAKQIGAAQTSVLPLLAAGVFYYIFNLVVASFMEYLAGGEEVSFDTIRNEIVYLLGAGSCVVDEIGSGTDNKGNAYHFDFVDDAANLALTVGGRTYTVTKAEQVESGAVSTYWFGQPVETGQSGADYPFVLHYYKDGTTLRGERYDECFAWEFHVPVTQFQRVELTYTVRLADPQTAAGTYGAYDGTGESGASALFTNNSAVLYSVDSTGVSGQPERFRRPTVSYTVSGSSGGGGGSGKLNTEEHYSYIIGYKDGLLRPYGEISRGEVAAIFFRMLTDKTRNEYWSQTNSFTDVAAEKWCNNAISTLFSMGIIDGYGDGAFRPDGPITRAAFTKMAVNFFDYHVKDYDGRFTDVDGDAWYAGYIQAAAELKLIEGFDDGTFRPNDYITRAQACTIINRTLGRVPDADRMSIRPLVTWPDCDEDAWYYADMMEATNSHDYQWITVGGEKTEKWTEKLPQRDWAALEHTWSTANSAKGGEVVG